MHQVRQVGEQPIHDAVHGRLRAEVVVVVEDEDELLLDRLQHFVQEHIDRALGRLREFLRGLLHV